VGTIDPANGWRRQSISGSFDRQDKRDYYDVTLSTPKDYQVISNGVVTDSRADGTRVKHRVIAGPVHEFTFALDTDFITRSRTVGNTKLNVHIDPYLAGVEDLVLDFASSALEDYSAHYGDYPFSELDLLISSWFPAQGMAEDGFIYLRIPYDEETGMQIEDETKVDSLMLEAVVSHEVGHQWWGALVWSDQRQHNFLIEGLTHCMTAIHLARTTDVTDANIFVRTEMADGLVDYLEYGDLEPVDGEHDEYQEMYDYQLAPLGFLAIREEIGTDAFDQAIASYTKDNTFGAATPEELQSAFETASGEDISDVWDLWFESDDISRREVNQLIESTIFEREDYP
jgi:aminopeptidase N